MTDTDLTIREPEIDRGIHILERKRKKIDDEIAVLLEAKKIAQVQCEYSDKEGK